MTSTRIAAAAALVLLAACAGADDREPGDAPVDSGSVAAPAEPGTPPEPADRDPAGALRDSLDALVQGPSAEERAAGAESWFSEETAGIVRSVDVDSSGHAVVDFVDLRPLIPNASTSAGSGILLGELNEAVFRFPEIRSVEYRMEGSCDLFGEWLQYGCQTVERPGS